MANKFENLSEEIEILIALRLSGEISNQENQKLETFFNSNPKTREQFLQKEKAYVLLAKTTQELPALQLSASKRNALLQLSNTKKSGRNILATYVVAASAFFAFMIGLYLYTDKAFQEPQHKLALNDAKTSSDAKIATDELNYRKKGELQVEKEGVAKAPQAPTAANEVVGSSENKSNNLNQPSNEQAKKINSSLDYDSAPILEEKEEVDVKKEETKLKGSAQNLHFGSKKQEGYSNDKSKEETKTVKELEKSAAVGSEANERSDAGKIGSVKEKSAAKDGAMAPEAKSEVLVVREEISKNEKMMAELKDKKEADEIKGIEKATGGGSALAKSSASIQKTFEYTVNIQFNQQEFRKKIISTRNLSNTENIAKMTFHEILTFTNLNTGIETKKEDRKIAHEKITIQDQDVPTKELKPAESKIAEAKSEAMAQEIGLISQCIVLYQKRNALDKNAQKQLLENIKKAMNSLSHIQKDEALKLWLEAIDKELKP